MSERRLRVLKWLGTTPAIGVCSLCSQEFRVPINDLRRTADAQASLQEQFDRHRCELKDSNPAVAYVQMRQEPEEDEDEEEDDRKKKEDDDVEKKDEPDEGYSV
jgi:hypothetical protein